MCRWNKIISLAGYTQARRPNVSFHRQSRGQGSHATPYGVLLDDATRDHRKSGCCRPRTTAIVLASLMTPVTEPGGFAHPWDLAAQGRHRHKPGDFE